MNTVLFSFFSVLFSRESLGNFFFFLFFLIENELNTTSDEQHIINHNMLIVILQKLSQTAEAVWENETEIKMKK